MICVCSRVFLYLPVDMVYYKHMVEAKQNRGKELLGWEVSDQHDHTRGPAWFVLAGALCLSMLIYAVSTRNFLFAFIIIMFAVIIATHSMRPAVHYRFSVCELGIGLGERFYVWKDIKQFFIAYEPPSVKTLYFDFGGLRPRLPVPLENTDPDEARRLLGQYISEDTKQTEEPLSDWLARVLKI